MKNTAEYYESKVLDIIERLDENAHITVATFAMQSIQVFATLAQAAAVAEQTEQARKWEEERQSK